MIATVAAASAFEWVQAVAGMVAALAALGTLVFLYFTVRGARELQRAQLRAHLLDLAADLDEAEMRAMTSGIDERGAWRDARTARHRFRAAIDSTGEELPACRALLALERLPVALGDAQGGFPKPTGR